LGFGADWFDSRFNAAFTPYGQPVETVRPFYGNPKAPVANVGVYAGDLCTYDVVIGCNLPANTMLSYNAYEQLQNGSTTFNGPFITSPGTVRFVFNGPTAEAIHGTPFGNVPRNPVRDYQTNDATLAIYKYIKVTERVKVRFDVSAMNLFNHPNFGTVDTVMEDAGDLGEGDGFGIPTLTSGGNRQIEFGLRVEF